MKKILMTLICTCCLFGTHPRFDHPENVHDTDIFLSFMRSGTNWLFTCIQALTAKPLYYVEHGSKDQYSLRTGINHLKSPLNENKKPLYHTHIYSLAKKLPHSNRLLLIVRNYKEVFIRRTRDNANTYAHLIKKSRQFRAYCSYLDVYDNWDPKKRLLVYYEDLLLKPKETLQAVLDFLQEDDAKLAEFMENHETYRSKTVQSYHKVQKFFGGSMSKGVDVLFHSRQVPTELLKETDAKMQADYPHLWKSYLKRYETLDNNQAS